jgi:hypothetical protein
MVFSTMAPPHEHLRCPSLFLPGATRTGVQYMPWDFRSPLAGTRLSPVPGDGCPGGATTPTSRQDIRGHLGLVHSRHVTA